MKNIRCYIGSVDPNSKLEGFSNLKFEIGNNMETRVPKAPGSRMNAGMKKNENSMENYGKAFNRPSLLKYVQIKFRFNIMIYLVVCSVMHSESWCLSMVHPIIDSI